MKIGIVGAGASGICAALSIKENHPETEVFILEKKNKIGSKILASGNGKCNIGNVLLDRDYYNDELFFDQYLKNGLEKYRAFLKKQNLLIKEVEEGRLYPYSESSASIVSAFRNALAREKIAIHFQCEVEDFIIKKDQIEVLTNQKKFYCDKLIIASGGFSYPELGTDGKMVDLLKKKQIGVALPKPSLTGFIVKEKISLLFGLRLKCSVSLLNEKKEILYRQIGEVSFKKDGLSGICVMNLSFYLNKNHINIEQYPYFLKIDAFPDFSVSELKDLIDFNNQDLTLQGIVDEKLIEYLHLKKDLKSLEALKNILFKIEGLYQFDYAQVTHGGVLTKEIFENFELRSLKNIYVIGEALHIDGICGGYNLYNAILNGILIGEKIYEPNH